KTVVHPIGIGVDDVVRQCCFRDSIRLSTQQLPAPELETNQGSQVEQVGVGYGLTDRFTERSRLSGICDRQLDLIEPSGDCAWNWALHRNPLCSIALPPDVRVDCSAAGAETAWHQTTSPSTSRHPCLMGRTCAQSVRDSCGVWVIASCSRS